MTNPFYTRVFNPLPGQRVDEQVLKNEYQRVEQGFDAVDTAITTVSGGISTGLALKANLAGGNTWSGYQNFLGATLNVPTPVSANNPTTKQFVEQLAFSAALPAQPGGSVIYALVSVGGVASWTAGGIDEQDIYFAMGS